MIGGDRENGWWQSSCNIPPTTTVVSRQGGAETVTKYDMATVALGNWISGSIINYTTNMRVHMYNGVFMDNILHVHHIRTRQYDHNQVQGYARSIENGITSLNDLYVPVKAN